MAITGAWEARRQYQSGALKWGTGWNPIHATHTDPGRQTAPGGSEPVPEPLTDAGDWGEDFPPPIPEFHVETPRWGDTYGTRADVDDYPGWTDNGDFIREQDVGADATNTTRREVKPVASAGWFNKITGIVEDAKISDAEQYVVATSMKQRDETRVGPQTIGRADKPRSSIHSRIPGMNAKQFVGDPTRNADMLPREQSQVIRAWWARQAGTGNSKNMYSNAQHNQYAMQRAPSPDPDQGSVLSGQYGYTDEDMAGAYY